MLFSLLLATTATSQRQTWLGADAGRKSIYFNYFDSGSRLRAPAVPAEVWGFNITQELIKSFALEAGLYRSNYNMGFCFYRPGYLCGGYSNAMRTWQIPIRLKYRFALAKDKAGITAHLGGVFVKDMNYTTIVTVDTGRFSSGFGTSYIEGDTIRYTDEETFSNFRKNFILLETGLALDIKISKSLMLVMLANYQVGFTRIIETNLNYTVNSGPTYVGQVYTNGNNFQVLIGLKYRLSNLWRRETMDSKK